MSEKEIIYKAVNGSVSTVKGPNIVTSKEEMMKMEGQTCAMINDVDVVISKEEAQKIIEAEVVAGLKLDEELKEKSNNGKDK